MKRRSLALVANFHTERRIGRKTANFLRAVHAHLFARGVDLKVEFVLDRPDGTTLQQIEEASTRIRHSRVHVVDFGNLGVSRTFGVQAARADVVCFTDGDDFFSLNWFEGAIDHFSAGRRREVLHTQFMVGFDQEHFIRETTPSTDPAFDPLSLAVDWYWSANLAVQADVFAEVPIEAYDHAGGFGSEDWHWTCNCLAAGIERTFLTGTSYFYRVKPQRFALGMVGDVIHMPSPLFTAAHLPQRPVAPTPDPLSVSALTPNFFEQAREIERFELGVSYLRALEIGAIDVDHFRPHTPPVVGDIVRAVIGAGVGDGSAIIFLDRARFPGGPDLGGALAGALTGDEVGKRLYVVDGDPLDSHVREDGFLLSLGHLRSAGLYNAQIERLIARFFLQSRDLTVINYLSPRAGSKALSYSRATRRSVRRWVNVVCEYGFDALSQAYDEIDMFGRAGLETSNLAIFEKTAREAVSARGLILVHDPHLEAAFVAGEFRDGSLAALREPAAGRMEMPNRSNSGGVPVIRVSANAAASSGVAGPMVAVTDDLRALIADADECVFACADAFLGAEVKPLEGRRTAGLRIPALSLLEQAGQPTLFVRHDIEALNAALRAGRSPPDLFSVGAMGVDGVSVRRMLDEGAEAFPLADLIVESIRAALANGQAPISLFSPVSIVAVSAEGLESMRAPAIAREVAVALSRGKVNV